MPRVMVPAAVSRRTSTLALLTCIAAIWAGPVIAQTVADAPRPALSRAEIEEFLVNAPITAKKGALKGVTDAYRVTLSDGRTTHDAQVQHVDIYKTRFDVGPKFTEFNFRDTYRYNVAAYRLAQLLGLQNVPVSVVRVVDGKPAAVTWWIDDVAMDEAGRMKLAPGSRAGPSPQRTLAHMNIVAIFDELIQNRDRNSGNLLWSKDWTLWMIDHTRGFRTDRRLLKPESLERCERDLFSALRGLSLSALSKAVGDTLLQNELTAVLGRRDLIVQLFEEKITRRGDAAVLFRMPN
jgi:hypothetical protein